jgi:hypothetical protein
MWLHFGDASATQVLVLLLHSLSIEVQIYGRQPHSWVQNPRYCGGLFTILEHPYAIDLFAL